LEKKDKSNLLLAPPERFAMMDSNKELKNIWDRDEKARIFTNQFNNFKNYYDQLTKPKR